MKLLYSQIMLFANKVYPIGLISGALALHCMECEYFQVITPKDFAHSFSLGGDWVLDLKTCSGRRDLALASELIKEILSASQLKAKLSNIFLTRNPGESVKNQHPQVASAKREIALVLGIRKSGGGRDHAGSQQAPRIQTECLLSPATFVGCPPVCPAGVSFPSTKELAPFRMSLDSIFGLGLDRFLVEKASKALGYSTELSSGPPRIMGSSYRSTSHSKEELCGEYLKPFGLYFVPELSKYSALHPLLPHSKNFGNAHNIALFVRRALSCRGYTEIVSTSLSEIKRSGHHSTMRAISLINPLNKLSSRLKANMVSSLLKVFWSMLKRGVADIRLFELGPIYRSKQRIVLRTHELSSYNLAIMSYGSIFSSFWKDRSLRIDLHNLKFELANVLGACGIGVRFEERFSQKPVFVPSNYIIWNDEAIGYVSELEDYDPLGHRLVSGIGMLEVSLSNILRQLPSFHPNDQHQPPETARDLSVVCSSTVRPWALMNSIYLVSRKEVAKHIVTVNQFDCFQRNNNRVLGFRIALCTKSLGVRAINRIISILVNHIIRTNKVHISHHEDSVNPERV